MKRLISRLACVFVAAGLVAVTAGCGKNQEQAAAEIISADSAITEKHDSAELIWNVGPDGKVNARVRNKDDLPITSGVSGSITVKPTQEGGAAVTVPLSVSPETGLLTGQLPKLTDDLTEVAYDLQVEGAKVQGTLHLPRGGTKELVESAREAAAAKLLPPDAKGPNKGIVQVVGDDIVEVVADKDSGMVRMYVLDDDLKVIPVGKRKGKLAFGGPSSEVIVLGPDPSGMYLHGKAIAKVQPVKITVVVIDGDEVDVALCHYAPGGVIVVGAAAPVLVVFVVTGWQVVVLPTPIFVQPGIIVKKGKGKGKWKGKWKF